MGRALLRGPSQRSVQESRPDFNGVRFAAAAVSENDWLLRLLKSVPNITGRAYNYDRGQSGGQSASVRPCAYVVCQDANRYCKKQSNNRTTLKTSRLMGSWHKVGLYDHNGCSTLKMFQQHGLTAGSHHDLDVCLGFHL
jgi:hypothetical protein